jgi:DNA modification methylase
VQMAVQVMEPQARGRWDSGRDEMAQLLESIDGSFLSKPRPELAHEVNWGGSVDLPLHRWYRYREGFSPKLISSLGLGERILDPFAGGGSILVGAAQQGRSAVGIDVNPLAAFVSRVKLSPLGADDLASARLFRANFERDLLHIEPAEVPGLKIVGKVFEPRILDTVLRIRALVDRDSNSSRTRDFLMLAWLSILEGVGSYFKEGNGIKYRNKKRMKIGYENRLEGVWQLDRFGPDQRLFVRDAYSHKLDEMLSDTGAWAGGAWDDQLMVEGNSIECSRTLRENEFDSIIFSPPYANRFDYFESMKVELWFGGFVDSYEGMKALRKRSLRSHLGAALDGKTRSLPEVAALIQMLNPDSYATRMRVPALLHGYFDDMYNILVSCRSTLKPGGECHVVVGNSAYAGVIIPTDSLIATLAIKAGFENVKVIPVRHLTVAPQQRNELSGLETYMRESVVVLS